MNFEYMHKYAKHWILLVDGCYRYLQEDINQQSIEKAHEYLIEFSVYAEVYYSKKAMTHNLH